MEAKVKNYSIEIERLQKMDAIDDELSKPINLAIVSKPMVGKDGEPKKKGNSQEKLERLDELEVLLEKNEERRTQVMDFFTSGLLDPVLYSEEIMRLEEEREVLVNEQDLITKNLSGGYERQKALENILSHTAKKNIITEFDDALFLRHVDRIIVYSRTEIGFVMKFGPVFKERI